MPAIHNVPERRHRECVGPAVNEKQITYFFGLALGGLLFAALALNALTS